MKFRIIYLTITLLTLASGLIIKSKLLSDTYSSLSFKNDTEQYLQREIQLMKDQAGPVLDKIKFSSKSPFTNLNTQTRYPLYVYKRSRLYYWSDFHFIPDYGQLSKEFDKEIKYFHFPQGHFLVKKWKFQVKDDQFEVFGVLPLKYTPSINNNYLKPTVNRLLFRNTDIEILDDFDRGISISLDGEYLFSVDQEYELTVFNLWAQFISIFLIIIGLLLVLYQIQQYTNHLANSRNMEVGFLVLVFSLIALRSFMLFIEFPNAYAAWLLFDPKLFASSALIPTIGDLLLNSLVVFYCVWYLFRNYHRSRTFVNLLSMSYTAKLATSIGLVFLSFFALSFPYFLFGLFYDNPQWSLDITNNLNFSFVKVLFYLTFILNASIFFICYHIIFRVISKINDRSIYEIILSYSLGALLFITIANQLQLPMVVTIIVNTIYFFMLFILKLPRFLIQMRYLSFLYLFSSALVSSLMGAYSIYMFEEENEYDNKVKFANQFLVDNDNLAELMLSEAVIKIKEDPLITSRIYSPFMSKEALVRKIKRVYLSSYFDKYNVQVYLYNAEGQPFDVESTKADYGEIKQSFGLTQYGTEYEDLYFVNRIGADVTKRYIYFIDIKRYENIAGHIILDLSLKKIIPNSVYPELLVDNRYLLPYQRMLYNYAIFSNDQITYNAGDLNYAKNFNTRLLSDNQLFENGITYKEYEHFAVTDQDNRVIVISSSQYQWIRIFSNFSFLFLISILIILLMIGIYSIYTSFTITSLRYATRIQFYLNVAFVMPLFIVSFATISLINNSSERKLENEYYNRAQTLSENITSNLDDYNKLNIDQEELSNKLSLVAQSAGTDLNLFNVRGRLIASSQPLIYNKLIISEYINPLIIREIIEGGNNHMVIDEKIGDLLYNSTYLAMKSTQTGELLGILSIPFFNIKHTLEKQEIEVFTNILNIFIVVFILFLGISYFASKRLTFPLTFIAQKLKRTSLSEENEPIVWKSDDEIGMMVDEYNKMLENLEDSKRALAISEKESAWREMARQVAHEIKNPLTPMKLTLQHLERILKEKVSGDKRFEKPINTLLYQIETLDDIATSFGTFANMPVPEIGKFELTGLLRKTFGLYKNIKSGTVKLFGENGKIYVFGDEQLIGRVFSNILINSIQSVPEGKEALITGDIKINGKDKVVVSIEDNGNGIPENIKDKIFVPNFSTKSGGSGIGLAIAKRGIEHAGGKIWFETEEGIGTKFFVELPLAS